MVVAGMDSESASAAAAEQFVGTAEIAVDTGFGSDSDFVVAAAESVGLAAATGCDRNAAAPVVVVGLA